MDRERFVAEFIAPNMTWQRDWAQELLVHGVLPAASPLPERVQKRLAWQAVAEFTYLSHRGRNLERLGKAALAPRTALVEQAARQLTPHLHEALGLHGLAEATAFPWLGGWLTPLPPRRRRIARGAGQDPSAVGELLKSHKAMQRMMKEMNRRGLGARLGAKAKKETLRGLSPTGELAGGLGLGGLGGLFGGGGAGLEDRKSVG